MFTKKEDPHFCESSLYLEAEAFLCIFNPFHLLCNFRLQKYGEKMITAIPKTDYFYSSARANR